MSYRSRKRTSSKNYTEKLYRNEVKMGQLGKRPMTATGK